MDGAARAVAISGSSAAAMRDMVLHHSRLTHTAGNGGK
jgi:hypothetical protein